MQGSATYSILSGMRAVMRDLFLEELRVDQGWSEFIDLLLSSLDLTALGFTQTNGMREQLLFSDYLSVIGSDYSCISSYRGTDSTGAFTLYVVNPYVTGSAGTYYDYGDCRISSTVQRVTYSTQDGSDIVSQESDFYQAWLYVPSGEEMVDGSVVLSQPWRDASVSPVTLWTSREALGLEWGRVVDLTTTVDPVHGDSLPCTFIVVVYDDIHTDVGDVLLDYSSGSGVPVACVDAGVQLGRVPQQLNVSAIYRARSRSGVGVSLSGVRPNMAGFWGILSGLGLVNASPIPYSFYYYRGADRGTHDRAYSDGETLSYVDFRGQVDATASAVDGASYLSPAETASYVGAIAAAPTPLVSAVWDSWGVGNTTTIYGYDKKYWVVGTNRSTADINVLYLGCLTGSTPVWGDNGVYPDSQGISFSPLTVSLGQQAQSSVRGASVYGSGAATLERVSPETTVAVDTASYPTLSDFTTTTSTSGALIGTPDGVPLVLPNSVLGFNDYGLTKDEHLLSYGLTPIDRIVLSVGCLKQTLVSWLLSQGFIATESEGDSYISWLTSLLQASAPLGITVQISFEQIDMPVPLGVYGSSESVTLYIEVSPSTASAETSGSSTSVDLSSNVPWTVSGEVGPYIRVQQPDGSWGSSAEFSFDGIQTGTPTEEVTVDANRVIASVTQED